MQQRPIPVYIAHSERQDDSVGAGIGYGVACGVASVQVARASMLRKKIVFTNDSPSIIYLSKTDPAALNAGYRINPNGGTLIDEPDNLGYLYKGQWYAITVLAAQNLAVAEEW